MDVVGCSGWKVNGGGDFLVDWARMKKMMMASEATDGDELSDAMGSLDVAVAETAALQKCIACSTILHGGRAGEWVCLEH